MPKILITGNGFDLSLGLPTSYKDFMNVMIYLEDESNKLKFKNIYAQTDKRDLNGNIVKTMIPFDLKRNDSVNEIELIYEIRKKLKSNLWYQFFKDELKFDNWIDFENRIKYALENLLKYGEYLDKEIKSFNSGLPFREKNKHYTIRYIPSSDSILVYDIAKKFKLLKRMYSDKIEFDSNFCEVRYNKIIGFNFGKLADLLFNDLEEFTNIFIQYIVLFINPYFKNFIHKPVQGPIYLSNINKHYTFNYTTIFSSSPYLHKVPTNHIHGKIDGFKSSIVLGVYELEGQGITIPEEFFKFYKSNQRLSGQTEKFDFINYMNSVKNKNEETQIFIFGHSLDTSDKYIINEVFNYINSDSLNKKSINIYAHSKENLNTYANNINLFIDRSKKDQLIDNGVINLINSKEDFINEITRPLDKGNIIVSSYL